MPLLAPSGRIILIGVTTKPLELDKMPMVFLRQGVQGSLIGGIKNTQEVVDLCASKGIYPEVKVVPVQKLNWVMEKLHASNDSGVRYVLELKESLCTEAFQKAGYIPPPDFKVNTRPPSYEELVATLKVYAQQVAFFGFGVIFGMVLMKGWYEHMERQANGFQQF